MSIVRQAPEISGIMSTEGLVGIALTCPRSGQQTSAYLNPNQLLHGASIPCDCSEECVAAHTTFHFAGIARTSEAMWLDNTESTPEND